MKDRLVKLQEPLGKLKDWWNNLSSRDKIAVGCGTAAVVLFILYQGIWSPILTHIQSMRESIVSDQKTLLWMKAADSEIKHYSANAKEVSKQLSPVELLSVLQKKINEEHLNKYLTQLKQVSNNSIIMQFQKVDFDRTITLLIELLDQSNVTITQFNATSIAPHGIVNLETTISIPVASKS